METLIQLGEKAKKAARALARASSSEKNEALKLMSQSLVDHTETILTANALDLTAAKENGISENMMDRLILTQERIKAMANGIIEIADLPDPIGKVDGMWKNEAGLTI